MLCKEYIVFTAFLVVNVMLAMNCFTLLATHKMKKIADSNFQEYGYYVRKIDSKTKLFWNSKNQIQISFSNENFCIQTIENSNQYKSSDVKKCETIQKNGYDDLYKTNSESKIGNQFEEIEELLINTDYPNNLIFLLKNNTYLAINSELKQNNKYAWTIYKKEDSELQAFLEDTKGKLIRKKINTMVILKTKIFGSDSRSHDYISFLFRENEKRRIIEIDASYLVSELEKRTLIPEFIARGLFLIPPAVILDVIFLPITFIYYISILRRNF